MTPAEAAHEAARARRDGLTAGEAAVVAAAVDSRLRQIGELRAAPNFSCSDDWQAEEASLRRAAARAQTGSVLELDGDDAWLDLRVALELHWHDHILPGDRTGSSAAFAAFRVVQQLAVDVTGDR